MFDFSFLELLLISVIALLVVGPDRLPTLVRTIGFWVGRGRAFVTSLRSEFEREINSAGIKETERHLREQVTETDRELRDAARAEERTAAAAKSGLATSGTDDEVVAQKDSASTEEPGHGESTPNRRDGDHQ